MKRRSKLFEDFRRDRLAGLWLAALLLFLPYVQPLSEAMAAGKPFAAEICSSFGVPDKASSPVAADDCPDCIAGTHAPQFAAISPDAYGTVVPLLRPFATVAFERPAAALEAKRWISPPGQGPPSVN